MDKTTHPIQPRIDEIRALLQKFRVEDHLIEITAGPRHALEKSLAHRQQAAELERRLRGLHTADLAELMETLPAEERLLVWSRIPGKRRGEVLLELSDAVRETVIEATPHGELVAALEAVDADDLAYLSQWLPEGVFHEALQTLTSEDRSWVRASISYPEDTVGHLMGSEMVTARGDESLASIEKALRRRRELPIHTDKLFVVDGRGVLCGALPLQEILLNDPGMRVSDVMKSRVVTFGPEDDADDAARAFERYDLASAPVVNGRGKLIGRLTVDEVMDYVREASEIDALNVAGVVENEDLFANIWASARNRWLWLSINLVTAFIVSRIVGAFETTIVQLVALASLMPIVTSVAGNTGNQTTAIVIRRLALDQINADNMWHLFRKELAISLLNGAVWGATVGLFAFAFYQKLALSMVVSAAMMLTFLLAAVFGVGAPVLLDRLGRDPAMGSSVLLTGITDAMGFFIFLMLATLFLV